MRFVVVISILAVLVVYPSVLTAHAGHVAADGIFASFMHPILSVDHVLAMVLVGAWSMVQRGKLIWIGPATFLVGATGGLFAGAAGYAWLGLDHWLALSVLVAGLIVAAVGDLPRTLVLGLFALFGFMHGQAHVAEIATTLQSGLAFLAASLFLHLTGAVVAASVNRHQNTGVIRGAGFASAGLGLVLFASVIV